MSYLRFMADPLPSDAPAVVVEDPDLIVEVESSPPRSPPPPVGAALENLGNTCFLNAVLQCLTHTVPFVQKIRKADHSCPGNDDDGDFCSFCALKEHIDRCLVLSGQVMEPTVIAKNLSTEISRRFILGRQEDAHEFLQSLLDNLHTCLGSSAEDSLVKQTFGGRIQSQLRCCDCGYHSNTCEPLFDLSLEINDVDNILDALASFTKLEKMDGSETKFTCERCKSEVSMEKQLKLEETPEVLVLHLKRFMIEGVSSRKIDSQVEYPLEIDLNPYISYPSHEVQSKYDLYAVLVHRGFTSTGHYVCFIRSSSVTWHKFNDEMVNRVSESYVLEQKAYVLFYIKQGSSCWFSQFMEEEKTPKLYGTSPTSVLEPAERYGSSSSSEYSSSYLRGTSERHDSAVLCIIDSPTDDTSLTVMDGDCVETSSGTNNFPPDLPVRQPAFGSNGKDSEKAANDRITLQATSQCLPAQNADDLRDDESPAEDNDKENQLLPKVQVKQNGRRKASKPAAAEPPPSKHARLDSRFNQRHKFWSPGHGSLGSSARPIKPSPLGNGFSCDDASQQKCSTERSPESRATSGSGEISERTAALGQTILDILVRTIPTD